MMSLHLWAVLIWSAIVGYFDVTARRIPNWLSLGAATVAVAVLAVQGESAMGGAPGSVLAAAGLATALTLPAYIGGLLGAGDVKLAVAMALLTDFGTVVFSIIGGSLLAGFWAVLWLAARGSSWLAVWLHSMAWGRHLSAQAGSTRPVPFGAALAVGFAASLSFRASSGV